jgi:CRISPR system Cascade subunit CasA
VRGFVDAADLAASATGIAARTAFAGERGNGKASPFAALRESFFIETEDHFFRLLRDLCEKFGTIEGDPTPLRRVFAEGWLKVLKDKAIMLFDESVNFDALPLKIMERAVPARRDLLGAFLGYGGMGQKLFAALELATPQPAKKAAKKSGKAA